MAKKSKKENNSTLGDAGLFAAKNQLPIVMVEERYIPLWHMNNVHLWHDKEDEKMKETNIVEPVKAKKNYFKIGRFKFKW